MITCTRRIEFDAAHRIIDHESNCKMLHGHRYALELTFTSKELDSLGRVIDLGEIKNIFGNWINENLDHNTILSLKDKELGDFISKITGQKIYYLKENPTAENLSKHLFYEIVPKLFANYEAKVIKIKMFETPNCMTEINE